MVGVTREDPGLDAVALATRLEDAYGLRADAITYLPLGFDLNAAVYEVVAADETPYFLKVRSGPIDEPGLAVARALQERGVPNILAPLRTRSSRLWCRLGERGVVLYPFMRGENAADVGLTAAQWREFGRTLRAMHDSGLDAEFQGQLPVETFALPAAAPVRRLLATVDGARFASPAAEAFARF